jgi:hypothetical protein
MGKFIHLLPEERKELVNNIVRKLQPELAHYVKQEVGSFAITEEEVLKRVRQMIESEISARVATIPKNLKPRWFAKFLFE